MTRLRSGQKATQVRIKWNPVPVTKTVRRNAIVRSERVGQFLVGQIKRALSVGAPSVRLTASGRLVATTPATRGAAPRLVSGRLRNAMRHEVVSRGARWVVTRIIAASIYARTLELGDPARGIAQHPFMRRTILRNRAKVVRLYGKGDSRRGSKLRSGRR